MTLATKLATPPARRAGISAMDQWISGLPTDEATAVRNAVTNPAWGHRALLEVLIEEGAPTLADTSFADWRRKAGLKK